MSWRRVTGRAERVRVWKVAFGRSIIIFLSLIVPHAIIGKQLDIESKANYSKRANIRSKGKDKLRLKMETVDVHLPHRAIPLLPDLQHMAPKMQVKLPLAASVCSWFVRV